MPSRVVPRLGKHRHSEPTDTLSFSNKDTVHIQIWNAGSDKGQPDSHIAASLGDFPDYARLRMLKNTNGEDPNHFSVGIDAGCDALDALVDLTESDAEDKCEKLTQILVDMCDLQQYGLHNAPLYPCAYTLDVNM